MTMMNRTLTMYINNDTMTMEIPDAATDPDQFFEPTDERILKFESILEVPDICLLYVSHTTSETDVSILTLTSEYNVINLTINMAGMGCYSLPTIDYCGCSTRLLTLLNTDLIFRSVLF
jgi:hypothetical protein